MDIVNLTVILRIYAHAALINCICRLNDFIITSSEDGYINKFRIVEGGLAVFSPSKVARLVQGIVVVASRVFLVCYELATLK
ncbi:MAG: hypothetical protein JST59_02760 [Actinobacteria bacterium]|nr:hypothetical protein [Actinomycetota bacterium]